ncbi:MAG: aspartate/glutamate racemase family protein [Desulfobulbaceae bacterium]|nr:aspartate/glutamate racemase family protein [Desulfobulbaceae bacterium]
MSNDIAYGGKNFYGAAVGILMLETRFPRVHGDIGNGATWPFPVMLRSVRGASLDQVVNKRADGLLDAFVAAGLDLIAQGADGITTSCGFMSLFQKELADQLPVPVASSSLMQVSLVNRMLGGGKRAGVITVKKQSLSDDHLRSVGVPLDTPIMGTEHGVEFTRAVLGDEERLNTRLATEDLVKTGLMLKENHPDVGAIILECTNMAPYAAAIRQVTGVPVYSIYSFIQWFQAGLLPRQFDRQVMDPGIFQLDDTL